MWKRLRAEVLFRAATPIAHFEGVEGNHSYIAMTKIRRPKGGFVKVPVVSGNCIRNRMRFASSMALLRAAGLLGESLSESALRLLFNGGNNGGRGEEAPDDGTKKGKKKPKKGVVNVDFYRELTELVPSLALFGGCAGRIIPGKLGVGRALLVCQETRDAGDIPAWVEGYLDEQEIALDPARSHVEVAQNVRMDALLNPAMRTLLLPEAQVAANARLLRADNAQAADEATHEADKSGMMPYTFERICQGALLFWSTNVIVNNAVEEDTFFVVLKELLEWGPVVGGKHGVDQHGQLQAIDARGIEVSRQVDRADALDLAGRQIGSVFGPYVEERKDRIRAFLRTVEAA